MSKPAVARRYAQAACDLAEEQDRLDEFVEELDRVVEALKPALKPLFANPSIRKERKRELLNEAVGEDGENLIASLCHLLMRKQRFDVLPELVDAARREADRRQNRKPVDVETAYELHPEEEEELSRVLESVVDADVRLSQEQNESLLAGLRLHVDDYRIDYSVENQLERLRRRFT